MAQYGTVVGGYNRTTGTVDFRVQSSYKPRVQKIKRVLDALSKLELNVGWNNEKDATKAFLQEFGFTTGEGSWIPNKDVPARPFIRPAIEGAKAQIAKKLKDAYNKALQGGSSAELKEGMDNVGKLVVSKIRKSIIEPNKERQPLTKTTLQIRRKKGIRRRKPLLETGSMYDNVAYQVKRKRK